METWTVISQDLAARSRGLLRELQLLSYAPTQQWKTDQPTLKRDRIDCPSCHGEGGCERPWDTYPEVTCTRCRGRGTIVSTAAAHGAKQHHHESSPPPHSDSLHDKFINIVSYAFHNDDGKKLESLCVQMETELAHYRGVYRAEIALPSDEKAAMKKVVEVFVGVDPIEVSRRLASKVSPGWVEKARTLNRRRVQDGMRPDGWKGWTDEERLERVQKAVGHGWSLRYSAQQFLVPSSSLHDSYGHYWWGVM